MLEGLDMARTPVKPGLCYKQMQQAVAEQQGSLGVPVCEGLCASPFTTRHANSKHYAVP